MVHDNLSLKWKYLLANLRQQLSDGPPFPKGNEFLNTDKN
jgi:hypothetical protein